MNSQKLISMNEVQRLTSLSRTSINNYRLGGRFPNQVYLGEKRIAFVESEVLDWINQRILSRNEAA